MPNKCYKQTEEHTKKISQNKDRNQKISNFRTGIKFSDKHKKNISLSHKGQKAWNKGLTKHTSKILKRQGEKHSKIMKGRKGNIVSIKAMTNKNKGQKRTKEVREKISNSHKGMKKPWSSKYNSKRVGSLNPNWLGGITPEYAARFNKKIWKNIRRLVIQRDNHKCRHCNVYLRILDVHHKKPWRFTKDDNVNNLITLCRKCHRKEDSRLQRIEKTKPKNRIVIVYHDFEEKYDKKL